jgi:hypothetical protein
LAVTAEMPSRTACALSGRVKSTGRLLDLGLGFGAHPNRSQ